MNARLCWILVALVGGALSRACAQETVLTLGTAVSGQLATTGESHLYRVEAVEGLPLYVSLWKTATWSGYLEIREGTVDGPIRAAVNRAAGQQTATNDHWLEVAAPITGAYYIRVEPFSLTAAIPTPLPYAVTAWQQLPTLSATPTTIALAGRHSIRWFRVPATPGQPVYALADHNSENVLAMTLVKGGLAGIAYAGASGAKDRLLYLQQADSESYLLKVSDATVTTLALTSGSHLPGPTNDTPIDAQLVNTSDIHWYEFAVSTGEEIVLHLDKRASFATATPMMVPSPLNAPAATGSATGDVVEFLTPSRAGTIFLRLSGNPGSYLLRAARTHPVLPSGQWTSASLHHASDERWYETASAPNEPLYFVADQTKGAAITTEIYPGTITGTPATFTGTTSHCWYFPPHPEGRRLLIRQRAPASGLTLDTEARLLATKALPAVTAGAQLTGTLASRYQRHFYGLTLPAGSPLALESTLPLTLSDPEASTAMSIETPAAVAGLGKTTIIVVSASAASGYTIAASSDWLRASKLYYSTPHLEALIDLISTTVRQVKYYTGSNAYLGNADAPTQSLFAPEGAEYANGWQLTKGQASSESLLLSWSHPATQVRKELLLTGTAARIQMRCALETPRPMVWRNALQVPATPAGTYSFAVPASAIVYRDYTVGTASALYPETAGSLFVPTERWLAFWSSAIGEVYGFTLGADYQAGVTTDSAYTVARVRCPAGQSVYSLLIARPKPTPPYEAVRTGANAPTLALAHLPEAEEIPAGTPITATLTVTNVGTASASAVTVACPLPEGLAYEEGSASNAGSYTAETRTLTWTMGALIAGASRTVTYRVRVQTTVPVHTAITIEAAASAPELPVPATATALLRPSPPSLTAVTPATPGNVGPVTLSLTGTCLTTQGSVVLSQGETSLPATILEVSADRRLLRARADVTGRTGRWAVTVTNPGGTTATLQDAISLISGGQSAFWCELSAPPTLKSRTWHAISLQYGNQGTVDDTGRLLLLYVPPTTYTLDTLRDDSGRLLADSTLSGSLLGPHLLWLPRVAPGEARTLSARLQPNTTSAAGSLYPHFTLAAAPLPVADLDRLLAQAIAEVLTIVPADRPLLQSLVPEVRATALTPWSNAPAHPLWTVVQALVRAVRAHATLSAYAGRPDQELIPLVLERMGVLLKAGGTYAPLTLKRQYQPRITSDGTNISKVGPVGISSVGYAMAGQGFTYVVRAQNPAGASAGVTEVRIGDTLDASLNWTSLRLGEIRLGVRTLYPPDGRLPYHTFVDLRPEVNCMVEIDVSFNTVSGRLEWHFTGTHPVTGYPTEMLPPNTAERAPIGELQVTMSAFAKATLASGVQIRNRASISFDNGTNQTTNETINTIDAAPPLSAITSLPAVQEDPSFTVRWSGQDDQNGSGLAYYSIYVRIDDGPFALWLSRVSTTSAVYTGELGHRYAFYSVAEDAVGHVELPPTTPDTTIKIGRDRVIRKGLQLVSVPLVPTEADPQRVMQFTGGKWARYLPGRGYVSYGADPDHLTWFTPAELVPGRGYWGYWETQILLEPVGESLPTTAAAAITLEAGWNLIGNPWSRSLSWNPHTIKVRAGIETKTLAAAATAGWIAEYAWGWQTSATDPTTGQYWMVAEAGLAPLAWHQLDPWMGYWLKAARACTLLLPPPGGALPLTRSTRARPASGWQLQLVATGARGEDGSNWFGVADAATVARARQILLPPPALEPTIALTFEGLDGGRALALQLLDTPAPVWRFTVTSPSPGEVVTLSWPDLSAAPPELGLQLVDEGTGETRYLNTTRAYTLTTAPDGTPSRLRIEAVARGSLRFLSLHAAPPASRASGGHITYTLTGEATVCAEIRTLTGRLLRQFPPTRAPGRTPMTLSWEGAGTAGSLPPGVYLVSLTATNTAGARMRGTTYVTTGR
jgi:uncharacterized repeat protein (TIGR01451 family)